LQLRCIAGGNGRTTFDRDRIRLAVSCERESTHERRGLHARYRPNFGDRAIEHRPDLVGRIVFHRWHTELHGHQILRIEPEIGALKLDQRSREQAGTGQQRK
jgi:hypothetical protein